MDLENVKTARLRFEQERQEIEARHQNALEAKQKFEREILSRRHFHS